MKRVLFYLERRDDCQIGFSLFCLCSTPPSVSTAHPCNLPLKPGGGGRGHGNKSGFHMRWSIKMTNLIKIWSRCRSNPGTNNTSLNIKLCPQTRTVYIQSHFKIPCTSQCTLNRHVVQNSISNFHHESPRDLESASESGSQSKDDNLDRKLGQEEKRHFWMF